MYNTYIMYFKRGEVWHNIAVSQKDIMAGVETLETLGF